ncbi:MAG: hypothetical protein ACRD19_03715 [Terriglobia bacterium]
MNRKRISVIGMVAAWALRSSIVVNQWLTFILRTAFGSREISDFQPV